MLKKSFLLILILILTSCSALTGANKRGELSYSIQLEEDTISLSMPYRGQTFDGLWQSTRNNGQTRDTTLMKSGFIEDNYSDEVFALAKKNMREYKETHKLVGKPIYSFFKNGNIARVYQHKNNVLVGKAKSYSLDGDLVMVEEFSNGLLNGEINIYKENLLIRKLSVEDGVVKNDCHYENGLKPNCSVM